jgi:hypothetical protein
MVSSKTICCHAPIKQAYSSNKMNEIIKETYFLGNFPTHGKKNALGASKIPKPFVAMDQSIKPYPPKMIKTLK